MTVAITIGSDVEGRENTLMIDEDGDLILREEHRMFVLKDINLGSATTKRFADLISHLHRLSIYAVDAP